MSRARADFFRAAGEMELRFRATGDHDKCRAQNADQLTGRFSNVCNIWLAVVMMRAEAE